MNESLEQARILYLKACDDARMLTLLSEADQAPPWGLGFHAQQAVEKSIKCVLCTQNIRYPFTHDILLLINLLDRNRIALPPDGRSLAALTPFGTSWRYDADIEEEQTLPFAISVMTEMVHHTLAWAEDILNSSRD